MFWRVLWRLMHASRGPLALALAVVVTGAAVCAALLNLDLDAGEKLSREFRTLGYNVVVSPQLNGDSDAAGAPADAGLMDDSVLARIDALRAPEVVAAAPYLYIAALAARVAQPGARIQQTPVIVAGVWPDAVARANGYWKVQGQWIADRSDTSRCMLGSHAARQLGLAPGGSLTLRYGDREVQLRVAGVITSGSAEDNQILVGLPFVQQFAGLAGRVGLVQLSVQGAASQVEAVNVRMASALPGLEVRPVRQLAGAEGRLYDRIHGLLFVTVSLILLLTALGVLAAMAGLALERRRDVGLMKALGGTVRRVMRFFLVEATMLGLAGGLLGCGVGMLLSVWIGERVFAAPISPRFIVWPATLGLMVAVALAGSIPLRLLGRVRPAEILRGE